jgi:hypothetical protein
MIQVDKGAVIARLNAEGKRARANARWQVAVGFAAPYSVYVHENLKMPHRVGQAKFLEQTIREEAGAIVQIQAKALRSGASPRQALALGGNHLLSKTKPRVPVRTGFLRDSGFVEVKKG